ncbi:alpha/beta fold hydrolase [Cyclobacterium salsum]|uniref:alpha/beta fold hydrolase n=1 Tax=Cyclobacterium salsum TaxID=2666329 RepID=UPI001391EA30|nr:alpha/beta hydrolase [Cyclobacterium salsum]
MKQIFLLLLLIVSTQVFSQEGKFVEINGVKLYYEIHGQGEPLVLLHGGTQTHDMWTLWLKDLSQNYKVITVDMRGHGQSTNPTNNFSFREIAQDIFGLLKELNIDKYRAIGFSGGGMTLIHMATMQPKRIQSLVLFGATPYFSKKSREIMKNLTYENVAVNNPERIENLKKVHPRGEKQIRNLFKWFEQGADSYDNSKSMNFTQPYLSTIICPTLIIQGDKDPFYTLDIPKVMRENIPNSHLWIIPNLKHSIPQYGTTLGDMFTSTIIEFMDGKWKN